MIAVLATKAEGGCSCLRPAHIAALTWPSVRTSAACTPAERRADANHTHTHTYTHTHTHTHMHTNTHVESVLHLLLDTRVDRRVPNARGRQAQHLHPFREHRYGPGENPYPARTCIVQQRQDTNKQSPQLSQRQRFRRARTVETWRSRMSWPLTMLRYATMILFGRFFFFCSNFFHACCVLVWCLP
jgi:hypothetical protein